MREGEKGEGESQPLAFGYPFCCVNLGTLLALSGS